MSIQERGEFTPHDTIETAKALIAYAIGLPAFVGVKVLSTALYAQENTKTPVKVTLICATLNIVLCLILTRPYQHAGIAFATAIAGWVQVGILAYILHNKNDLNFDRLFKRNMTCITIATAVMCVLLYVLHHVLIAWFAEGHFKALLALAITMAVSGSAYLGLMFIQKVIDVKSIKQSLKGQGI